MDANLDLVIALGAFVMLIFIIGRSAKRIVLVGLGLATLMLAEAVGVL